MSEFYSPFETLQGYVPKKSQYWLIHPLVDGETYGLDNYLGKTVPIIPEKSWVFLPAWEGAQLILDYPSYLKNWAPESVASVGHLTKCVGVKVQGSLAHIYGKIDPSLGHLKITDDTRGNNTGELSIVASWPVLPNWLRICQFTYPTWKNPYTYALVDKEGSTVSIWGKKYFSNIKIIGSEIVAYDMYENAWNIAYLGKGRYATRDERTILFHKMQL